jgi:hypothetical protein
MPSISGRGFGWIPNDKPPARLFSSHPASTVDALPPRAFLTVPPALDQEALGSCTANGAALCVAILAAAHGLSVWLSRLMGYLESRKLLGPQYVSVDSGAMPDDALAVIADGKVGPESLWPYAIEKFARTPPAEAYAAAKRHSLKSYALTTVDEARQAIVARFPVNFGFSLRGAGGILQIDRIGPDGVYPWSPAEPLTNEGHDTVVIGYDDDRKAFCVANSWGAEWGTTIPGQESRGRGAYWMPYAMFASDDVSDRAAVTDWS